MDWITFFSAWGAFFYLLIKLLFLQKEIVVDEKVSDKWRIWSWVAYLIGVGAWLVKFYLTGRWIALTVEAFGVPAMVLGLLNALKGSQDKKYKWLDRIALIAVVIATIISLYLARSLEFTHILELGIAVGFFVGVYLLAKDRPYGYLWFVLMNLSNVWLQYIDQEPLLMWQQVVSAVVVGLAYIINRRRQEGR